jgi:[ribosomal protein S18]-alanine N-acetyltransferase
MADRLQIRPARPADAPRLVPLERRCFTDPWSAVAFEELLRFPLTVALVAERDDVVVGYLIARAIADAAEILNLAIDPDERGQGFGARLLEEGLAAVAGAGARQVWLEVRESNFAARSLYRRRGFAQVGRRARYYKNPVEDALVLRLALRDSGTAALD